jgi:hypothetical protein
MQHAVVRRAIVPAAALLLAAMPVSSVSADQLTEAPAPAAAAPVLLPAATAAAEELVDRAASLQPGEFVWQPERAAAGAVEIVVSIPLQRAFVYRGGTLIGVTTVSTGRPGHDTPTGRFPILGKHRQHFSNLYNGAPMPFMQRLTMDGIALHAGEIPGRPASHGCVRLPLAFARLLFAATAVGTTVHITELAPSPAEALAAVRGHGALAAVDSGRQRQAGRAAPQPASSLAAAFRAR